MRTQIKTTASGHVILSYDNPWTGGRVTREFFVGGDPGYVREFDRQQHFPQVCRALAGTGETLRSTHDGLAATIRREYRRMRDQERAEA